MAAQVKLCANPALYQFWDTFFVDRNGIAANDSEPEKYRVRYRVLYGGRFSSKSWDAAINALNFSRMAKIKVMCARRFQNSIERSVYTVLCDLIYQFGWQDEFEIQKTKIINLTTGSDFIFLGIDRNINEIKSTEGIDILWLEEAIYITKKQFEEILDPTIRRDESEVWLVFNPSSITDYVWQRFIIKPAPGTLRRLINYTENSNLSQTSLNLAANMREEDKEGYEHIYLGVPKEDGENAIIKYSWLTACVDAHKVLGWEPTGKGGQAGADPGDTGDAYGRAIIDNSVIVFADEFKTKSDAVLANSAAFFDIAIERGCNTYYFDGHGLGSTIGEHLKGHRQRKRCDVIGFLAGGGVWNPDKPMHLGDTRKKRKEFFENAKAAAWYEFALRCRNTYRAIHHGEKYDIDEMISISSDLKSLGELKLQLSSPLSVVSENDKYAVEKKKDMSKRGIASPNIADAVIMASLPRVYKKFRIPESVVKLSLAQVGGINRR